MNLKINNFWLALVIVVIVLGVIGMVVKQNGYTYNSAQTSETTTLKSYSSKILPIFFQYPKDWTYQEYDSDSRKLVSFTFKDQGNVAILEIVSDPANGSLSDYLKIIDKHKPSETPEPTVISTAPILLDGVSSVRRIEKLGNSDTYITVHSYKNGRTYSLVLKQDGPITEKNISLFDQLISTFKFTN